MLVAQFPLSSRQEIGVIDVALLSIIRRWHLRDLVPLREIARRLGISRNKSDAIYGRKPLSRLMRSDIPRAD